MSSNDIIFWRYYDEVRAQHLWLTTTTVNKKMYFCKEVGCNEEAFLSLGHRRMQVLLSLTGGVMLGVGLLHLLPHAFLELDRRIDTTMAWVLAGFFLMFLLERAFHGHAHHATDGSHAGHGCEHDHSHDLHQTPAQGRNSRWAWCGAFAGLTLHSLADGAALAASVNADGERDLAERFYLGSCYAETDEGYAAACRWYHGELGPIDEKTRASLLVTLRRWHSCSGEIDYEHGIKVCDDRDDPFCPQHSA